MFRPITRHHHLRPAWLRLALTTVLFSVVVVVGVTATGSPAAAETDTDPTPVDGPIDVATYSGPAQSANARFIIDAYQVLLGRAPENGGLDYQLALLASGGARSRQSVTYTLLFSVEGSGQEVDRAYQDVLDRATDPTGRAFWTSYLQGRSVHGLRVLLLASDEFYHGAGGTDQAWIERLYQEILQRPVDQSGLAYWLDVLGGGTPRALVAAAIASSDEALDLRVNAHFVEILNRSPTASELNAGRQTLRSSGERSLRAEILASDEAFEPHLQAALTNGTNP